MTIVQEIKKCIEGILEQGKTDIIICPFGDIGMQAKYILNEVYGIKEAYILDNHLCKYNCNIKPISFLEEIDQQKYTVILASLDLKVCEEIKRNILRYISNEKVECLASVSKFAGNCTKAGKHSTGSLCNHWLVESVGAFCSFADGTNVVDNHPIDYITTHHMIYIGGEGDFLHGKKYNEYKDQGWYLGGVNPRGNLYKTKKIKIGNDVWLGQNVLITNGSNIGNGVIAGAGAIITKDVPDYAVVVGVPARIIRYRYTPEQIKELNKIAWWDWTDEEIRDRFEDFYLPIEDFLKKYKK